MLTDPVHPLKRKGHPSTLYVTCIIFTAAWTQDGKVEKFLLPREGTIEKREDKQVLS